jgi:streptogrisin C
MKRRRKTAATVGGAATVAEIAALITVGGPANATQPAAEVATVGQDLELTPQQARARLQQQAVLHQVSDQLPGSPDQAGRWIDTATGRLMVAVVNDREAAKVQRAGATPKLVSRSQAQLDNLLAKVDRIAGALRGLAQGSRPALLAAVRRRHLSPAAGQQDLQRHPDEHRERHRHLDPPHR